jgi:hypothetical protein
VDWAAAGHGYGYFDSLVYDTEIGQGDLYLATGTVYRAELDGPGSHPGNPVPLAGPSHDVMGLAAADPYLLLAGHAAGFSVLDLEVEPPAVTAEVSTYDTHRIAVSGELAVSIGWDSHGADVTLRTIDLSGLPAAPEHIGEVAWPFDGQYGFSYWLALDGTVAVVGYHGGLFRTIDVSDPTAPRIAAEVTIRGFGEPGWGYQSSWTGALGGNVLYVGAGTLGLGAYDVRDPDAPLFLGFASVGFVRDVQTTDRSVLIGTSTGIVRLPLDCRSLTEVALAPEPRATAGGLVLEPYANPFVTGTAFRLAVPSSARPSVDVFDVSGRRVRSLVPRVDASGRGTLHWDGRDTAGRPVAPGVYFAHLRAGDQGITRKVVRVR